MIQLNDFAFNMVFDFYRMTIKKEMEHSGREGEIKATFEMFENVIKSHWTFSKPLLGWGHFWFLII